MNRLKAVEVKGEYQKLPAYETLCVSEDINSFLFSFYFKLDNPSWAEALSLSKASRSHSDTPQSVGLST